MKNLLFLLSLLAGILTFPSKTAAQTPTDKQIQAIEKLMAPQRKKVTDILEAEKTGQYKTYQADVETLGKERDPARQQELFSKLERDHLAFIRKAYAAAKINNADLKAQIAQILGSSRFSLDEFANIQIDFTAPALALPTRFDAEFTCPLGVTDSNSADLVAADCDAFTSNCSQSVIAIAEASGGCRGKTSVGDKFVISEGSFTKITVSVQSDIHYKGVAFAVAGYGQVNAKFGIRFQAPGIDKTVFAKEVFALAPIIWFSRIEGAPTNFVAQATFNGNFSAGTTITAMSYVEAFALSVPLITWTEMDASAGKIDFIHLTGSN